MRPWSATTPVVGCASAHWAPATPASRASAGSCSPTATATRFAESRETRRDALRVTQSLRPSVALDAVDALRAFTKPVLLAWGDADKLFPLGHARRLEADFPHATLEVIPGASTCVMLDQPDALARAIARFTAGASASPGSDGA